jgi:flagellar basal-body rod protein FlgB
MEVTFLDKTSALLSQMLDMRSERHRAVTSNIANQDTPGYKSVEVDFTQALKNATAADMLGHVAIATTHPNHIATGGAIPDLISGAVVSTIDRSVRLDGNSVNAEKEMAKLAENTLMYNATTQILATRLKGIKSAIRSGF